MSNFKYCQSAIGEGIKCVEQCPHCMEYYKPLEEYLGVADDIKRDKQEVMKEELTNYVKEEGEIVRKRFDLDTVLTFTEEHRVEVVMGSDYQYEVYIDGEGSYASGLTATFALWFGIENYKKDE